MSARFWLVVAILLSAPTLVPAQQTSNVAPKITSAVDISSRVTIPQSKHPLAQPAFDVGPLDGTTLLQHMVLVLGVSPEQGHQLTTFAPAVVVAITDAQGNPVTTATNLVTMAIGTNPLAERLATVALRDAGTMHA